MPTPTYTPLANITLGSAAQTITFSSIPNTYRDLIFVFQGAANASVSGQIRFNGNTATNYNFQRMTGDGSAASAASRTAQTAGAFSQNALATTTSALHSAINIFDYATTDKHKTFLARANNAANGTEAIAGRWASNNAITSVQLISNSSTWAVGTTVALYGVIA